MKKSYLLFITLFMSVLFWSCKKLQLTKKTKEGKNTFSCIIDGEVFKNCSGGLFSDPSVSAGVHSYSPGIIIGSLYAKCYDNNDDRKELRITLQYFHGEGEYSLVDTNNIITYERSRAPYSFTSKGNSGTLKITKDDRVKHILSGEFEGTLSSASNANDKIKVKNGRFDADTD